MVPPTISNPRKLHAKREVGPIEEGWINLQPFFKTPIKQEGFVAPLGSLQDIEHLLARIEAIKRLADQQTRDAAIARVLIEQDKELPSIVDEFRANGFKAISLSSSSLDSDDDDLEAANYSAKNLGYVPYNPDPETIAPLTRRIEWERFALECGQTQKVWLVTKDDGTVTAAGDPGSDPQTVRTLGRRLRSVALDTNDLPLEMRRARAEYYHAIGSCLYGKWKGAQWPEQSLDELGAEDQNKPDEVKQGPQELGLHNLSQDDEESWDPEGFVLPEPSDFVLEEWAETAGLL